jgi:hypothetical protein
MSLSKTLLPLGILIILAITGYYLLQPSGNTEQVENVMTTVKKGPFSIEVNATGELKAKKSVKIRAPQGMRAAGIYETTISDLIAEGTVVSEGQYVASLDRTELAGKMSNLQTEIEKIQTQLEQAKIDTAIELRGLRDQLVNLDFSKKEKELNVEQNRYEPQSVIQQTKLDLERTERDYRQLVQKYELKQQQAVAKIQEINALLKQNQMQLNRLNELSDNFSINAPKTGMVIYARSWRGKKEPGSRVSAWDPVVAELPDLTDMISKTYVNEVDISKVRVGQEVEIKVDAFPDNSYAGQVIQVANIGEQLQGYDAKVFEVTVQLIEVDSILRPAMTTSNEILTHQFEDILFVPLEAIHSDSLTFVYLNKDGKVQRQEVITGLSNDNEIAIDHGLAAGQEIYLSLPPKMDDIPISLIPEETKASILKQQKADAQARQAKAKEKERAVGKVDLPASNAGGNDMIVIFE